jgi:hypothetical protein
MPGGLQTSGVDVAGSDRAGPVSKPPPNPRAAQRRAHAGDRRDHRAPPRLIGKEMTPIHPGLEERIALELGRLPVRVA